MNNLSKEQLIELNSEELESIRGGEEVGAKIGGFVGGLLGLIGTKSGGGAAAGAGLGAVAGDKLGDFGDWLGGKIYDAIN